MVYFVCAACGTSLKKNQVTSHWFKCRSDKHVSCMDCGKDFWGEDYNSHIKCITEDQKYGGSNYVSKENKGERKQEEWVMKIKEKVSSTQNMDPQVKELLQRIVHHSNIPRKEAKFRNFMRSSFRVSNTKLVDKVWEIFKDVNSKSDNSSCVNGVRKDASVTDTGNSVCKDVPQASTETEKGATDTVNLNKREKKELRREKQSKKSKKDKHVEHASKAKSGTKRKLDCTEEVEPAVETEEPRKKKKKKQESLEQVEEAVEVKKKKKKKQESLEQIEEAVEVKKEKKKKQESLEQVEETVEVKKKKKKKNKVSQEALLQGGGKIQNGTIVTNGTHVLRQEEKNVIEPPQPAVFKWTSAIKRVLAEAPEEGLKLSKLQRKVFSLYYSAYGEAANMKSKEELAGLLSRKLNKKNKFIVHKDRVKLQK